MPLFNALQRSNIELIAYPIQPTSSHIAAIKNITKSMGIVEMKCRVWEVVAL